MTIKSKCKGYDVEWIRDDNRWYFCDTRLPMLETQSNRVCGSCGLHNTADGHDACLGVLPDVANACCGHGRWQDAYIQYVDGTVIEGLDVIKIIEDKEKENTQ